MRNASITVALASALIVTATYGEPSDAGTPLGDADRRNRMLVCLLAFRQLPAERQARLRSLDKALHEDDAAHARLWPIAERYAAWRSRLTPEQRESLRAVPPGPERTQRAKLILDQQWRDALPPSLRNDLERAYTEDRERRNERMVAHRFADEATFRDEKFKNDVKEFVAKKLDPLLTRKERTQLNNATTRGAWQVYVHYVAEFSQIHGVTPPGNPDFWKKQRETKPRSVGNE